MKTIMCVFGTRPEAIKLAPVIKALEESLFLDPVTLSTGQHREMLDQVTEVFNIKPDLDLNIISHRQTLTGISVSALQGVTSAIERFRPDGLIVQGDTTTSTFAAIAGFYARVPVFHLEAGLRTGNIHSPFPEEANRKFTTQIAALHLAPTKQSKCNLVKEGVAESSVVVTGNTVIDSLQYAINLDHTFDNEELGRFFERSAGSRVLLVTAHRRENLDGAMQQIGRAIAELARKYENLSVLLPIHLNPAVREAILPEVELLANVHVTDPLSYLDFTHAMKLADVVLTDSGGVQEEAPALGKPVLVMRDTTERPEAVEAGTARLIGTATSDIVMYVSQLLDDPDAYAAMSEAVNPYGDGNAANRVVAAVERYFGVPREFEEFVAPNTSHLGS